MSVTLNFALEKKRRRSHLLPKCFVLRVSAIFLNGPDRTEIPAGSQVICRTLHEVCGQPAAAV